MGADWGKIKTEYITSNISYRELAKIHGISYQAICRRSKSEGWIEQREQHLNKTVTKTVEKIGDKKADRAARLQSVADKLLGKVESLLEASDPLEMDTQSMKHISGVLKDIKEIQMIRSDADMREQEARIRNLQKQAERDEDNNRDVTITIEGGDPSWQS